MPGQGRIVGRSYTSGERVSMGDTASTLGSTTFDIHLNRRAWWCNVPADVWRYKLGGYQVLKKWLSYREHHILGRPLQPEEVQYFTRRRPADRCDTDDRFADSRLSGASRRAEYSSSK